MREPALPVDPGLPGEPTLPDVGRTQAWLARRGVAVWLPARLLALRIGARGFATRGAPRYLIVVACLWWFGGVLFHAVELPGRAAVTALLVALYLVLRLRRVQAADEVAERLAGTGRPPAPGVAAKQIGWWYLVSAAVTFAGGAFAPAVGAGAAALVLARAFRAPVIAEDEASRQADEVLRAEDVHRFAPCAVYAFLAMPVFVVDWAVPGALGWWALAYLVAVAGMQLTGWLLLRRRYRRLPPGYYGR
ncbi:hypothetical protein [Amycolatopsis sp. CA-128772]|uniref:hypothetical protein n=1 Tax=Amycolatopsis sp. CA-128772 TaxID=2073159 RepID=UPI000CD30351|nr:hypothetical protein [Amycolatopsis sp. CA-128772]